MSVGMGFDAHRLVPGRRLIIGGVEIPHHLGLLGHSDADVLVHAVMDALLGAAGLGDIGMHFPDRDDAYRGISSLVLLERVAGMLREKGLALTNLDCTIVAQAPRMAPHIPHMRENLARVLCCSQARINIKATTTESMGFTGSGEGICALAVCQVEASDA